MKDEVATKYVDLFIYFVCFSNPNFAHVEMLRRDAKATQNLLV